MIDVGSNSVLLLVADQREGRWVPILETSAVTGLGEGTKATGLLSERGMVDTLSALSTAWSRARELGVERVLAAATMAARIATNTQTFLDRAASQGTPVVVLSGEDEAEYGFKSVAEDATLGLPQSQRFSVIDVGGHSTELVVAESPSRILYRRSFPVGTLGLRSAELADESPPANALLRACTHIDQVLIDDERPMNGGLPVVLGATGTNLVTIREKIAEWDSMRVHGACLDAEEVSRSVGWLSGMTDAGRRALVGIEPGRERTIHIGSLILERCLYVLNADRCLVSVRGWRHALLEAAR